MRTRNRLAYSLAFLVFGSFSPRVPAAGPPYRDPSLPIEQRVEDLLARMTLEEKVGQMNMPCVYEEALGKGIPEKTSAVQKFAAGTYLQGFGPGGGFFTLPNTILHEGPHQQAEFLNRLQKIAIEQTRLGIPLLETEEGTHGLMCPGGTIFPEGPGLASTWNMNLRFSSNEIHPNDSIEVSLDVRNTGSRAGADVVQLYLQDVVSSVSRPAKELHGFHKVWLDAGEVQTCKFKLSPDDLALYDRDLHRVVEPGEFRVMLGASSEDIRAQGSFWVK